jgi:murein DD-endopeptidase MepM/ murein hydrolase activator NlpD
MHSFLKNNKKFLLLINIIIFSIFFFPFLASSNISTNNNSTKIQTLKDIISQKNEELKQIEVQKEEFQKKLNSISNTKNSLSKEIQAINYQIKQLDLKAKANKIVIEKLSIEIENSNKDIEEIQNNIEKTKKAIARLLLENQQANNKSLLFVILSENNLSSIMGKINNNYLLQSKLVESTKNLNELHENLNEKLEIISKTKKLKEMENINLINNLEILEDQKLERNNLLQQTKNEEKLYQEKLKKLEEQQLQISKIIESIESQLRENFNPNLLPSVKDNLLSYPVENPYITQYYGKTDFAEIAYRTKFHTGIDFKAPLGTPIYAAADGIVKRVDNNDRGVNRFQKYQYGKYILIDHQNNLTTLYAHLSSAIVKTGEFVKRGQVIGYSGNTGYSIGPHLHFGLYYTPQLTLKSIPPANGLVPVGLTIDPLNYLVQNN